MLQVDGVDRVELLDVVSGMLLGTASLGGKEFPVHEFASELTLSLH